jgi:hypothetical protein
VLGSVHQVEEPNPYITIGLDTAGIGATLARHTYLSGGLGMLSSMYNPDPLNIALNGIGLSPGVGDVAVPLTVVNDAGGLAGGVITNNVMAPMIMGIPGNTMNDGQGYTVASPKQVVPRVACVSPHTRTVAILGIG